jgi:hypothetical protein
MKNLLYFSITPDIKNKKLYLYRVIDDKITLCCGSDISYENNTIYCYADNAYKLGKFQGYIVLTDIENWNGAPCENLIKFTFRDFHLKRK